MPAGVASTTVPGMPADDATHVEKLKEVGRYALGVEWGDRHDSILPYRSIRLACPCDACGTRPTDAPPTPGRASG